MTGWLADLVAETVRAPQGAARRLIALDLPAEARWMALALVAVLALLEMRLALMLIPELGQASALAVFGGTWTGVPLQFLSLVLVSAAIAHVGRAFGGTGSFADAMVLVAWMEFVLTLAQGVQIVALLVFPPLGLIIGVAAVVLFAWLVVQFTAALHGFTDLLKVFIGIVVSFVAFVTIVALLLTLFGIAPPLPKG